MAQDITVVENRRALIATETEKNVDLINTLPEGSREKFKENLLSFVTQDYLMSIVAPREIIRFAVNISKQGLSIDPAYKEVYIVPFDTKVNGQKVMLPQAIIPLNGMQEMAYQQGFFLKLHAVYKLGDEVVSEKDMTRSHQIQLKTADPTWVDSHFVGFDVVLTDFKENLPEQVKFVELSYLQAVTKTLQDQKYKIQTWRHKAVRRAYSDFFIPRSRKVDVFEQIESLNDQMLKDNGVVIDTEVVGATTTSVKTLGELATAVQPVGIMLTWKDGQAVASGNTHANAKLLKGLGFTVSGSAWVCPCIDDRQTGKAIEVEVETPKPIEPIKINDLADLGVALQELGLELEIKESGGKTYAGAKGVAVGCEEQLTALGFKLGKQGGWGRDVSEFVKQPETKKETGKTLEEEGASLF